MDEYFFDMKPIERYLGEVFYHKELNLFVQIRKIHDDHLVVGGFCKYYNDAKTCIDLNKVSWGFKKQLQEIKCIDTFPYAEHCPVTHSWKVKETK